MSLVESPVVSSRILIGWTLLLNREEHSSSKRALRKKENTQLDFPVALYEEGDCEGLRSGLRPCIAVLEASLQTRVPFRAVSQPAVIGSPIRRRIIGPELFGLGSHCK